MSNCYQTISEENAKKENKGIILITLLWVLVGLSLLAFNLAATVTMEADLSRSVGDAEQAYFYARGGIEAVLYLIAYPDKDIKKQEALFPFANGQNHYVMSNEKMICHLTLQDETGKLDLNFIEEETLERLLLGLGVAESPKALIIESLLKRRKPSQEVGSLNSKQIKRFRSVEELLSINGVSRELIYGVPKKLKEDKVGFQPGLIKFLTVYSGSPQVNINYAAPEVLAALPGMTEGRAQQIVQARKKEVLMAEDVTALVSSEALSLTRTKSSKTYSIIATAWLRGSSTRRSIKVVARSHTSAKGGHRRLVWYDEYWPSEAETSLASVSELKLTGLQR